MSHIRYALSDKDGNFLHKRGYQYYVSGKDPYHSQIVLFDNITYAKYYLKHSNNVLNLHIVILTLNVSTYYKVLE